MSLQNKAKKIKAILLDIDGVLTDCRVGYHNDDEVKFFHVRDGHGIKLAIRAGIIVGAVSGRSAAANKRRANELGFSFLYESQKDKREAFAKLLEDFSLTPEECLYIGDDVIDIPIMRKVGIAVTVADAPEYIEKFCDFRTKVKGGYGAVREVIDWLLMEQGKWDDLMVRYIED
jgi:YrbI family 3-deoxy-D-manno-octulosonate 8-phosphate phosphatase